LFSTAAMDCNILGIGTRVIGRFCVYFPENEIAEEHISDITLLVGTRTHTNLCTKKIHLRFYCICRSTGKFSIS